MTLVSHRRQFIFLRTHKTASTSVEASLEHLCLPEGGIPGEAVGEHRRNMHMGPDGIIGSRGSRKNMPPWRDHMSARSIRSKIGRRIWSRYFKFAVVRNPFDRLVSMYFYRMEDAVRQELAEAPFDEVRRRFHAWLPGPHPRNNLTKLMIGPRYVLDHVIYYERLATDLAEVAEALEAGPLTLPRYKGESRVREEHWSEFYDDRARRVVERACGFELAFFGYDFEGGPREKPRRERLADFLRLSPLYAPNAYLAPRPRPLPGAATRQRAVAAGAEFD